MAPIDPPRAIRVRTSTGWADLAIKGAPGAPGLPRFDYLGGWAAGTYYKGQLAIRNGVTYMCVRDTTTQPPASWSSVGAVPTPVVNGQWLKGVGGALAWQPIAFPDLPVGLVLRAQGTTSGPAIPTAPATIPEMTVTGTFLGGRPVLIMFRVGFTHTVNTYLDIKPQLDGADITNLGSDCVFGVQTFANSAAAQNSPGTLVLPSVTAGSHTISLLGVSGAAGGNYFTGRRHLHVYET